MATNNSQKTLVKQKGCLDLQPSKSICKACPNQYSALEYKIALEITRLFCMELCIWKRGWSLDNHTLFSHCETFHSFEEFLCCSFFTDEVAPIIAKNRHS